MKKILSIFLVSIVLFGCSKDDDTIQDTTLDSNLFGNWSSGSLNMTLSSNGNFVYYHNTSSGYDNNGTWWVEGNHLLLSGNNRTMGDNYSVNDGELYFLNEYWY